MGFDNECIPNIQSLPGEYFCPVCRTLIYPNEALQSQCTHLYCKPCLAYIVATTQACPYDGYLVTETDSKPLMESNKSLAEAIGKVTVHCLYHRSGCSWQGTLSDCIAHCTSCAFGNSPVVCNRCGTQIVHRQVQEHAQICPGLQPQAQQVDGAQAQSSSAATQAVAQGTSAVASAAPATAVTAAPATTVAAPTATTVGATAPTVVGTAGATAAGSTTSAPPPGAAPAAVGQGQAVAQASTAEQWYQQQMQYQQYYQQQYPGYNPYMQYQQYGQYQQSHQQHVQPQMQPQHGAQASVQPSPYAQPQPQVQQPSQPQPMVQSQPQSQPHLQPQLQAQAALPQPQPQQQHAHLQPGPQRPQMQVPQTQVLPQLPHPQAQSTAHPPGGPGQAQPGGQPFGQPVSHALQPQLQPHMQPPMQQHLQPLPHQQPVAQQQLPQPQPPHLQPLPQQQHAQPQMQPHSQIQHQHAPMQLQGHAHPQAYPQHQTMPHAQPQNPSTHAVTGHQSYPQPQPAHQMPPAALQQHPMHMHAQQQGVAPQQSVQMRPPQGQFPVQGQPSAMLPLQGPHVNAQHAQQQPHHVGPHAQQMQGHASIPSQAPQQGFPPQHASFPLQAGQQYHQGTPSSQQQMHPQQPFRPQGPQYMQQHVAGQSFAGHQAQTAANRPTSHGFQHLPSGAVKTLQPGTVNQQPPMLWSSVHMGAASEMKGAVQQPSGQISLPSASAALQSGKPEKASNATCKTEGSEPDKIPGEGVGSVGARTVQSDSLGDEKMTGDSKEYEFDKVRKDAAQTSQADAMGTQSDNANASNDVKVKEDIGGARREGDESHDQEGIQGDKETKAADGKIGDRTGLQSAGHDAGSAMNYGPGDLERGSVQHPLQQNMGGLGSHVLQGSEPQQLQYGHRPDMPDSFQRPPGPDRMIAQHMPYHMQGQRPDASNQMRPPSHNVPENIRPPPMQQPHGSYHSEVAPRAPGRFYGQSQIQMPIPQSAGISPHGEGMIRPPMGGPLPGLHDMRGPSFAPEHVGRPRPPVNVLELAGNTSGFFDGRQGDPPLLQSGMAKVNGVGGGQLIGGANLNEEGFTSAGEHLRPFTTFPGRYNINRKDIEDDLKQFSRPSYLDGEGLPRPFDRNPRGPDGFHDSIPGRPLFPHQSRGPFPSGNVGSEQHPLEFGERHRPVGVHEDFSRKPNSDRIDGMPPLRNPGLFLRGMQDGPGGLRKEQLGSGNLPGNMRHDFDGPEFPHSRFNPGDSFGPGNLHGGLWRGGEPLGHGQFRGIEPSGYGYPGRMHPGDPEFVIDYSRHVFPKESGHFGLGGHTRKRDIGWCRICMFNCGSAEDLDMHVQTRDHQQMAMEVVLKMKQEVGKKQKLSTEGPKSFDDKKVAGKANFGSRGNRR